ncbi:flagellar biosynthesis protein FlhA [Nocardioides sp. GY 10113]|uniref:flagellar biosynthesis protein FlhA n=1 Tax=Nocardioides sp. GY 10113 TaxID=2569761 RepID=UPI0010A7B514|nr:flagellar biosynthesis protein FlhA [Nocardioides sp. GY 10113]TIC88331.1 flagellar biosynthesis protein FlhA [Nocardioides sp. GY 10113]
MPVKSLQKLAIPVGIVMIIVMLVVPLPAVVLDLLIALNITGALMVLMVAMFIHGPLEFAGFPAVILVMTLFRLALNISATRLVLLDGYAGKVIDTFGHFVVGGSLVVGLIVFVILLVIQFVVITNGAGRVAEVGARFTLDAMPGKQMAIDADLNSGLISEDEARRRRAEVHAEADFYGAMDGASKFVKGDAIAAIVITLVNLIGGFAIGVAQYGMPWDEAISTYSLLSIGDGLVSQIPALLLSVATGLIVTRSVSDADMGSDIVRQITARQMPLRVAGFGALALCLIPGLPKTPFIIVGGAMLIASTRIDESEPATAAAASEEAATEPPDSPERLAAEIRVDPLGLELSADLIDLVDARTGGDLLDRVKALRRKIAGELGIVIPPVRTRDNLELPPHTYAITLFGAEIARGEAPRGTVLAIGDFLAALPGTPTREPVFGLEAKWIPAELRHQAEIGGATVVDRASVVTTHLAEVVHRHASSLLGREDVRLLTDVVKRSHPVVIEELTPTQLSLGEVQRVLRSLLDEGVPIRDLVRIFEALSVRAATSKDLDGLVDAARAALDPALAAPYVVDGVLHVISLDPVLEQQMLEGLRPSDLGAQLLIDPDVAQQLMVSLAQHQAAAEEQNLRPVLVCAPQIRSALRRLVAPAVERLPVFAYTELGAAQQVRSLGVVSGAAPGPTGTSGPAGPASAIALAGS